MTDVALRNAAVAGAAADLSQVADAWYAIRNAGAQVSNERLQPTYGAPSAGAADLTVALAFTGTVSQAVSHLGVYDAEVAGTLRFEVALSGDLSFNASGDLNLTNAPVTVADAP